MAWTCPKCKTVHQTRNKLRCDAVIDGKVCNRKQPKKPARKAHLAALDLPYEGYVEINGGEFCWICDYLEREFGIPPVKWTRLHRDHDHQTGEPRGLLCFYHNKRLVGKRSRREIAAVYAYMNQSKDLDLPPELEVLRFLRIGSS